MNIAIKQLKLAWYLILNGTCFLLQLTLQRDSQYFYIRNSGTNRPFVLVIKNSLHPQRIIKNFFMARWSKFYLIN